MYEVIRIGPKNPYSYYQQASQIHIAEIHHGTLSLLGAEFLARLYFELAKAPESGMWVAIQQQRVVGFIVGCMNVRDVYFTVLKNATFALFFLATKSLFNHIVLRKILTLLIYPFRGDKAFEKKDETSATLLAIAVERDSQGQGIGKSVIESFEKGLIAWGLTSEYYVSTNRADANSNGFYKSLGFIPYRQIRFNDLVLQVYKKSIKHSMNFGENNNKYMNLGAKE